MARGQSEPTALGTGAAESAPSSLWGKCRPLAQCRVVFARGEQARGWEDTGQNWSLCWDLSARRAKAAGVVAAPGPGQRHGAPGAVQLCRPRAPRLLASVRLAGHAGHVCLPLMPLPPAPVAPGTAVLRAEVCLQTWSRLACAHQPGQRLGGAHAEGWVGLWGRLGGRRREAGWARAAGPGLSATGGALAVERVDLGPVFSVQCQMAGLPGTLPRLTERGALGRALPSGLP